MGNYIVINNVVISGTTYRVQRLLQEKGYFEKEYFHNLNNKCIGKVRYTIDSNKDELLNIVKNFNIGRYGGSEHALRLLIYTDANISAFIRRLQTHGKNLYASYIKEEINQAIDEDYMKMPEYVRNAIPKAVMVNEIVKSFLYENQNNIRKAVSDMVYANLRKLIDAELF